MSERRIYVASLSDYNAGNLLGVWIDVDGKSVEEIQEEVNAMLASSEQEIAEEFAIHDHEGLGNIGEFTPLSEIVELSEMIDRHGDAYLAYIDHVGAHYATKQGFEDSYEGEFDSKVDWGDNYAVNTGMLDGIPMDLRYYFDMEKWVRDCELNGDISFVEYEGTLYAFRNC
jgi:antirestriction protein